MTFVVVVVYGTIDEEEAMEDKYSRFDIEILSTWKINEHVKNFLSIKLRKIQ